MSGKRGEHVDMPDLRLLPTEALVLHEHADEKRVAKLETRLRTDGFLKNPPIVAPIPGTERYVVLDGANRTSAVARIGCPHILAQVVDYDSPNVHLLTWHHLVTGREPKQFLDEIATVDGVVLRRIPLKTAREELAERGLLAYIVVPPTDGERTPPVYGVDGTPGTEHHGAVSSTRLLNAMVDTYKGDPRVVIHRGSSDDLAELADYYDDISGLVVFPPYTPADILKLAEVGTKVPTGITRHIIGHRALRVNVPITLLAGPEPLEEKDRWWHDQFKRRLANNEVRLYTESTYLFDE